MGMCGGWHCKTEQARKKERWERKDSSSKEEGWRLGPVLKKRKSVFETIAVGSMVGMV